MRRWTWTAVALVLVLAIAAGLGVVAYRSGHGLALQQANTGALVNGGFEGEYVTWGAGEVQVAPGWAPWYSEGAHEIPGIEGGSSATNPTARPEYRAATLAIDAYRVRSGEEAQVWFSFMKTNYAGIYQSVPTEPGAVYEASVWAQCWAANDDGNPHSCPWELYISVGIDPDGGAWYKSRSIQWSQWQRVQAGYTQFASPPVVANKARATVYIASAVKFAGKHGDIYVDDAQLELVKAGNGPCPTPEPTRICPTAEPGTCTECDYERVREIVATEVAGREPVRWPR